ncbi:hypothetical protein FBF28_04435 [Candidatus Saccharibacteria bacterium oral taxon 488]|nr:hypothetical protein FBF28_04435 [Candidatus Saccharibacteria bacterium oral taxon 488]
MNRFKGHSIDGAPVVGVTGTYYTDLDDVRFEIALDTAAEWNKWGLPFVVVDGSPDSKVAGALRARGATVLTACALGIASQRQEGARYVIDQGGNKIITSEPEKPSMPEFAEEISRMLNKFSVVVIGRTEASKESMPPFQRRTEELAGWVLERTLGLPPDALAGPRGYSRQGIQHLLRYPSDRPGMNNWIYMYDNPLAARANGERVGAIEVDLIYPESQVEQETDNPTFDRKRYEQFALQLNYLLRRPEIKQPADDLRNMVLGRLALMSERPTDKEIKEFFNTLEAKARGFGYKKNNKDTQYLSL